MQKLMKYNPAITRAMDGFLLKLAGVLRDRGWRSVHISLAATRPQAAPEQVRSRAASNRLIT